MQGDFTRDTFDVRHHYTRVLMQQGRVQLDADWNEQTAIRTHKPAHPRGRHHRTPRRTSGRVRASRWSPSRQWSTR